jgi:hAT family C-terminal dimerisation region
MTRYEFSILQFLHQVKGLFPTLVSMTYDIFIVSVSTIAFELYLNAVNKVLTDKRMRLCEKVFEALVLLKDWYDTESSFQDKS